ncbi:MAG: three-Cys-motif partner protein TcmP [Chloroflexi bacterium]|nr:three-Cys-motif partner protein TcmP [Chloroflexota bacterium]
MQNYLKPEDDLLTTRSAGEWAAIKLDYLVRYINVFETAMRGKWSIRNYIDLMAGPGKNRIRETDAVLLGSPLLALTTKYAFTGYFFADLSDENTTALDKRCSASPFYDRVHIHPGDCNEIVREIVVQLKRDDRNSLNLAFLDPEGFELEWQTIAQLATIRRIDLIINYPQGGLNRQMALSFQSNEETIVDRFFGDTEWRKIFAKHHGKENFVHRQLMDHYKQKLQRLGYPDVRRDDETGDEPLIRNSKNAPLYRLLFASKSKLGNDFWQKITRRDVSGQTRLF